MKPSHATTRGSPVPSRDDTLVMRSEVTTDQVGNRRRADPETSREGPTLRSGQAPTGQDLIAEVSSMAR